MHAGLFWMLGSPAIGLRVLDAFAFSGLLAAAVAGALVAMQSLLLAPRLAGWAFLSLVTLASSGTLVVYAIDRLRDVENDRRDWPDRARWASQHRSALRACVGVGGVTAAIGLQPQPVGVWWTCAAVFALGLLHRRLKTTRWVKLFYLTLTWSAVAVGLPWIAGGRSAGVELLAPSAGAMIGALAANMVASNASSDDSAAHARALRQALLFAGLGIACGLRAKGEASAVALVPVAQACALVVPRAGSERHRLWILDGSLACGAALALGILALA